MASETFRTRSGSVLHIEETGDGLPVLALHGLGGGAWFFSGFAKRLAPDCRVVSIDLPGTGRSVAGAEPSIALWVDDIRDLIADRVDRPAVILGHSLGTILALRTIAATPEHVRAAIFVGGLPEPRAEIKERLTRRAAGVAASGLAGVGPQIAAANFARATLDGQPEIVGMFERLFEAQDPDAYVRACRILIGASAHDVVSAASVPSLSITGAEDQYAPPQLVGEFLRGLPQPAREEVLADCGHFPFLEAPDAFARLVKSFLATLC